MSYALLKTVHVTCVLLSAAGFTLRGALALAGHPVMQRRWIRVVPHLVDTVLLASAIAMAVLARLWPPDHPWLASKILLLLLYVVLGSIALRAGRSFTLRATAYGLALATFAAIVAIAITRQSPLSLLG